MFSILHFEQYVSICTISTNINRRDLSQQYITDSMLCITPQSTIAWVDNYSYFPQIEKIYDEQHYSETRYIYSVSFTPRIEKMLSNEILVS